MAKVTDEQKTRMLKRMVTIRRFEERVKQLYRAGEITGAIQRPGVYVFADDHIALTALVDSAGGFTSEADLEHAHVQRTSTPR